MPVERHCISVNQISIPHLEAKDWITNMTIDEQIKAAFIAEYGPMSCHVSTDSFKRDLEIFEKGAKWAAKENSDVVESLEWALMTISDQLKFGMPEELAVYRRESRVKGVLIDVVKKLKGER